MSPYNRQEVSDSDPPIRPQRLLSPGGANNHADRQSLQLSEAQCRLQLQALEASLVAGTPPNRFVTALWERGGIGPKDSVRATGQFIALARDWCRARGHNLPWQWTQEWGEVNGAHCHILLHVPPELDPLWRPMPMRWAKHILGGHYVADVMRCDRVPYSAHPASDAYLAALYGKLHYMLKCAPTELEGKLDMTGRGHKPWGQSSLVYGKRAGVWQGWKRYAV